MRSDSSLFIEARRYADEHGVDISHSKLSRLIRQYRREVATGAGPTLPLPTFLRRSMGIADPTGNTAVRNVMSGGGARV
ncbi:hypothetical protein [Citricoccus alkalitolerans]|uniref:Uncharacterized protein n=1 Tax=Citricoccus alkalitolerans TaxID=246603 RepID=A0ABV8XZY1_9MICC